MAAHTPGLSMMTPAQVANAIAGYTRGLPKPLTDPQISARASALLDPLVKQTTDRINASTKTGASAISGYANKYADALAGYGDSAKNIYGGAEQAQAAADAAESGALRSGGSQLADQLAGKIGQISSSPNVMQAGVGPVTGNANGAANATLGSGSAALAALIGQGTAAQGYAAKLPGIARGQGASDIRDLSLASQKNLADQIGQLESKTPDLIQSLRSQSDQRASNIASVRNQASQYYEGRNLDVQKFLKAEQDAGINATTKANATVTAAKIKAQSAAEAAQAKAAETSFKNRLAFAKTYGYDPVTNQTLPGYTRTANGTVTKAAKAGAAAKGALSDAATIKLVRQFHDGTTQSATVPQYKIVNGKPDPTQPILDRNGAPVYKTLKGASGQMDYGQAYAMLKSVGHKTDAEARAALNTVYQRGERGRSWVTNEEQAALKSAGVQAKASVINGHGVLSAKQVAALHKAGVPLPPGQITAEGAFVIAKGY